MSEVLLVAAFFMAVVLAFFSTKWYMSNSTTMTSGIGGLLNLYYKQFITFFIIWWVVLSAIVGLAIQFLAAYGKYLAVGIAIIGGLAAYGSKDDGTEKHKYILIGTIILALGVYFVSDAEQEKATVKQKAHDKEVLAEWDQFKREMGINNQKDNKPDTSADRQTNVPKEEKPTILFDFSKYGINDVSTEEQLYANASKNDNQSDEEILKWFYRVRRTTGGKPLDREKNNITIPYGSPITADDFCLGAIALGDSIESVKKKLGTYLMKQEQKDNGITFYSWKSALSGIEVYEKNGVVVAVASNQASVVTPRGASTGDGGSKEPTNVGQPSENELIKIYGQKYSIQPSKNDDNINYYIYEGITHNGKPATLRFGIRKDNKLLHLTSMRYNQY